MMADKSARCPVDGLNQKFRIVKDNRGRKSVEVSKDLSEKDLSEQILCQINVDSLCDQIFAGTDSKAKESRSFEERATWYAEHYARDKKIVCQPSMACAKCEFCTSDKEEAEGLKSGIQECWTETLGWSREDFNVPTVLDIWNFRNKTKLINAGRIKMSEVTEEDISPKGGGNYVNRISIARGKLLPCSRLPIPPANRLDFPVQLPEIQQLS